MRALDKIAKEYMWPAKPWHYALAELISGMAVYGIFGYALVQETTKQVSITLPELNQYYCAEKFRPQLEKVFAGKKIEILPPFKPEKEYYCINYKRPKAPRKTRKTVAEMRRAAFDLNPGSEKAKVLPFTQ